MRKQTLAYKLILLFSILVFPAKYAFADAAVCIPSLQEGAPSIGEADEVDGFLDELGERISEGRQSGVELKPTAIESPSEAAPTEIEATVAGALEIFNEVWNLEDPEQKEIQMILFGLNLPGYLQSQWNDLFDKENASKSDFEAVLQNIPDYMATIEVAQAQAASYFENHSVTEAEDLPAEMIEAFAEADRRGIPLEEVQLAWAIERSNAAAVEMGVLITEKAGERGLQVVRMSDLEGHPLLEFFDPEKLEQMLYVIQARNHADRSMYHEASFGMKLGTGEITEDSADYQYGYQGQQDFYDRYSERLSRAFPQFSEIEIPFSNPLYEGRNRDEVFADMKAFGEAIRKRTEAQAEIGFWQAAINHEREGAAMNVEIERMMGQINVLLDTIATQNAALSDLFEKYGGVIALDPMRVITMDQIVESGLQVKKEGAQSFKLAVADQIRQLDERAWHEVLGDWWDNFSSNFIPSLMESADYLAIGILDVVGAVDNDQVGELMLHTRDGYYEKHGSTLLTDGNLTNDSMIGTALRINPVSHLGSQILEPVLGGLNAAYDQYVMELHDLSPSQLRELQSSDPYFAGGKLAFNISVTSAGAAWMLSTRAAALPRLGGGGRKLSLIDRLRKVPSRRLLMRQGGQLKGPAILAGTLGGLGVTGSVLTQLENGQDVTALGVANEAAESFAGSFIFMGAIGQMSSSIANRYYAVRQAAARGRPLTAAEKAKYLKASQFYAYAFAQSIDLGEGLPGFPDSIEAWNDAKTWYGHLGAGMLFASNAIDTFDLRASGSGQAYQSVEGRNKADIKAAQQVIRSFYKDEGLRRSKGRIYQAELRNLVDIRENLAERGLNTEETQAALLGVMRAYHQHQSQIGKDGFRAKRGNYTNEQLTEKRETLSEAGLGEEAINWIMDQGFVEWNGNPDLLVSVATSLSQASKERSASDKATETSAREQHKRLFENLTEFIESAVESTSSDVSRRSQNRNAESRSLLIDTAAGVSSREIVATLAGQIRDSQTELSSETPVFEINLPRLMARSGGKANEFAGQLSDVLDQAASIDGPVVLVVPHLTDFSAGQFATQSALAMEVLAKAMRQNQNLILVGLNESGSGVSPSLSHRITETGQGFDLRTAKTQNAFHLYVSRAIENSGRAQQIEASVGNKVKVTEDSVDYAAKVSAGGIPTTEGGQHVAGNRARAEEVLEVSARVLASQSRVDGSKTTAALLREEKARLEQRRTAIWNFERKIARHLGPNAEIPNELRIIRAAIDDQIKVVDNELTEYASLSTARTENGARRLSMLDIRNLALNGPQSAAATQALEAAGVDVTPESLLFVARAENRLLNDGFDGDLSAALSVILALREAPDSAAVAEALSYADLGLSAGSIRWLSETLYDQQDLSPYAFVYGLSDQANELRLIEEQVVQTQVEFERLQSRSKEPHFVFLTDAEIAPRAAANAQLISALRLHFGKAIVADAQKRAESYLLNEVDSQDTEAKKAWLLSGEYFLDVQRIALALSLLEADGVPVYLHDRRIEGLMEAHYTGTPQETPEGLVYSEQDIAAKARILKEAGWDNREHRRILFESRAVGAAAKKDDPSNPETSAPARVSNLNSLAKAEGIAYAGRDKEVTALERNLSSGNRRVTLLTGAINSGRSTVVRELARRIETGESNYEGTIYQLDALRMQGENIDEDIVARVVETLENHKKGSGPVVFMVENIDRALPEGSGNQGKPEILNGIADAIDRAKLMGHEVHFVLTGRDTSLNGIRSSVLGDYLSTNVIKVQDFESDQLFAAVSRLRDHYAEKARGRVELSDPALREFIRLAESSKGTETTINYISEKLAELYVHFDRGNMGRRSERRAEYLRGEIDRLNDLIAEAAPPLAETKEAERDRLQAELDRLETNASRGSGSVVIDQTMLRQFFEESSFMRSRAEFRLASRTMGEELSGRVIGQDHVVQQMVALAEWAGDPTRAADQPLGIYFFAGTSGVGKTEMAKALAEFFYGNKNAVAKIKGGEFQNKADLWQLVGSGSGYEGNAKGGELFNKLAQFNGRGVLLIDEVEKMHPDVLLPLLDYLENGVIEDKNGNRYDISDTLVIFTSNLEWKQILEAWKDNPEILQHPAFISRFEDSMREAGLRNELLGRVDKLGGVVIFNPLEEKDLAQILEVSMLKSWRKAVAADPQMEVDISEEAVAEIAKFGYKIEFGARSVQKNGMELIRKVYSHILADMANDQDGNLDHLKGTTFKVTGNEQGLLYQVLRGDEVLYQMQALPQYQAEPQEMDLEEGKSSPDWILIQETEDGQGLFVPSTSSVLGMGIFDQDGQMINLVKATVPQEESDGESTSGDSSGGEAGEALALEREDQGPKVETSTENAALIQNIGELVMDQFEGRRRAIDQTPSKKDFITWHLADPTKTPRLDYNSDIDQKLVQGLVEVLQDEEAVSAKDRAVVKDRLLPYAMHLIEEQREQEIYRDSDLMGELSLEKSEEALKQAFVRLVSNEGQPNPAAVQDMIDELRNFRLLPLGSEVSEESLARAFGYILNAEKLNAAVIRSPQLGIAIARTVEMYKMKIDKFPKGSNIAQIYENLQALAFSFDQKTAKSIIDNILEKSTDDGFVWQQDQFNIPKARLEQLQSQIDSRDPTIRNIAAREITLVYGLIAAMKNEQSRGPEVSDLIQRLERILQASN